MNERHCVTGLLCYGEMALIIGRNIFCAGKLLT